MSVLERRSLTCPGCGVETEHQVAASVSGDSEERRQILDGTFQRFRCGCGVTLQAEGPLMYLDMDRKHWIACFPQAWEPAWRSVESEPLDSWRRALVDHAPKSVREDAHGYLVRAVFGLAALREKLLCLDAGIDDRILEMLKVDLLRAAPLSLEDTLRLDVVEEEMLRLVVSDERTLRLPRARLAAIEADRAAWADAIRAVSAGPYVDAGRLFIPGTEVVPS